MNQSKLPLLFVVISLFCSCVPVKNNLQENYEQKALDYFVSEILYKEIYIIYEDFEDDTRVSNLGKP